MLLCYSSFNPLHILPSQIIRERCTCAHVTTLTVSHSPTLQDALDTQGRAEFLRAPVLRERLCLALKTPCSFAPGPGGDSQHWVLQQDKLTPPSWMLPGLGGLLPPHRQSKSLGRRMVGKPAGPSSTTPHEPAQDVLAFLDCCQTGTRIKGWH